MNSEKISKFICAKLLEFQKDYASAKDHSREIDHLLGYNCDSIEIQLKSTKLIDDGNFPKNFWIGLDLQTLQTPYSELLAMICYLKPADGEVWLDLGAGYGRMGVILGFLRKTVHFKGYEYVPQRSIEGNRIFKKWNLNQAKIIQVDLTSKEF